MSFKLHRPAPKSAKVTSPFGFRTHPISGKRILHRGIDFGGKFKATVAINGVVSKVGYSPSKTSGFGHYVQIRFNDLSSGKKVKYRLTYAHGSHKSALVAKQHVSVGKTVFVTGHTGAATGDHLHFQLERFVLGVWKPIDPKPYL